MDSFDAVTGAVRQDIADFRQAVADFDHLIKANIARDPNYVALMLQQLMCQATALGVQLREIVEVQEDHEMRLAELEAWKESQIAAGGQQLQ